MHRARRASGFLIGEMSVGVSLYPATLPFWWARSPLERGAFWLLARISWSFFVNNSSWFRIQPIRISVLVLNVLVLLDITRSAIGRE